MARQCAQRAASARNAPMLGVTFALLSLLSFLSVLSLALPSSAQVETLALETSEGTITIGLLDFPDVADHAENFKSTRADLGNESFFHRGEKVDFCDATYCFLCKCTAGLCESDPNARTCDVEGEEFWIVEDQTEPARYLQSGRFILDENYAIVELGTDLPTELPDLLPTFANTAFTIAYVRDEMTKELTSEWVINLEDNPLLDDPFGDCGPDCMPNPFANAYFVFGTVEFGRDVVEAIAAQKTYDATNDPTLLQPVLGLEQVPVFDTFNTEPAAGDSFTEPCDPGDMNYLDCLQPECLALTTDGLACEDPRCVGLRDLTLAETLDIDDGLAVARHCDAPALPSFPVVIPEPRPIAVQVAAVLAMTVLAARKRRSTARAC